MLYTYFIFFFFFNDTATTEIYTLSLHDALPIFACYVSRTRPCCSSLDESRGSCQRQPDFSSLHVECRAMRSEEHTSELQSRSDLVCRLLLEKKKQHDHQIKLHMCLRDLVPIQAT